MEIINKQLLPLQEFMQKTHVNADVLLELGKIIKKGRYVFVATNEMRSFMEDTGTDFFSIGTQIGEIKKDFMPTPWFIDFLSNNSERKAFINNKSEWMFLCGKDIFQKGIEKIEIPKRRGLIFVQNKFNENLGLAKFMQDANVPLENILDKGAYVRKEI